MPASPNTKEIILNCMPPFTVGSPSAALSILKAYLCKHGYSVRIIYWNILLHNLENEFTWNKCQNVQGASTLIYAAYLAVKNNNKSLYNEVKAALQTILPVMLNEKGFFDEHIEKYADKLEQFIDDYLDSIDFKNVLYFGFSVNMNQWIIASILAEKIKKIAPNIPIVIGGITTDEIAKVFLNIFHQFDIAIWGEGEVPLEKLTQFLLNKSDFSKFNIERSCYREKNIVKVTTKEKHNYYDLSTKKLFPDFNEFFEYRKLHKITEPVDYLIIEGGRGCHWNRCHFCYLNKGYKYRQKKIEKISQEIKYMISSYGIFRFIFVDSDVIGKDISRFHSLIEELAKIKNEYSDFIISEAEIISLDLSCETIKRMREAGFVNIQIGFECTCDTLLKKIDKKNTFATNLNAIKHCTNEGIHVGGANVIYNLLEETEEDINESIENLRFYRFILCKKNGFVLNPIPLQINSLSKYYNAISDKKQEYFPRISLFHKAFFHTFDEDLQWHFFEYSLNQRDAKWNYFEDIHYHYKNNRYEYKFFNENDKITYHEFLNNELTEHIEFGKNDLYISILDYCFNKPISIQELQNSLSDKDRKLTDIEILLEKVDTLFFLGLLYRTHDYTEITSIVNIKKTEL